MGKTLQEIRFRHNYLVAPLALYREDRDYYTQLGAEKLKVGDAVLMHGAWRNFKRFRQTRDLIFSQSMDREMLNPSEGGAGHRLLRLGHRAGDFQQFEPAGVPYGRGHRHGAHRGADHRRGVSGGGLANRLSCWPG